MDRAETAGELPPPADPTAVIPSAAVARVGPASRSELRLVLAIVLLAVLHNLVYAAAFPFFSALDEQSHLDLVVKLARGYWPLQPHEPYDEETIVYLVGFGSPEFFSPPERFAGGRQPLPLWRVEPAVRAARVARLQAQWRASESFEAHSPPVYYALAAVCWKLLQPLSPAARLYGLRFLDAGLLAGAVLMTWRLARRVAPGRREVTLGAPLLLAMLPLDVLSFVNSDALAPLLATAALVAALAWARRTAAAPALALAAGLLAAATTLTNAGVGLALGLVVVAVVRRRGTPPGRRLAGLSALLAAALPLLAWAARNRCVLGDWSGTAGKVAALGWQPATAADVAAHPLWTPDGAWTFLADTLAELWRGGVFWHGRPLAASAMDGWFVGSSLVFLGVAGLAAGRAARHPGERVAVEAGDPLAVAAAWTLVLSSLLLLAALSLRFVFPAANVPNAAHPYFTQARLIAGAIPAFLVLYADGAGRLARRLPRLPPLLVPVAIAALAASARLVLTWPVFASEYNLFHLP